MAAAKNSWGCFFNYLQDDIERKTYFKKDFAKTKVSFEHMNNI